MDISISWSGPGSRAVAEALKELFSMIVDAFNPWVSCADIDKGAQGKEGNNRALCLGCKEGTAGHAPRRSRVGHAEAAMSSLAR